MKRSTNKTPAPEKESGVVTTPDLVFALRCVLPQQTKCQLWQLVRLRKNRHTRLLQDLTAG